MNNKRVTDWFYFEIINILVKEKEIDYSIRVDHIEKNQFESCFKCHLYLRVARWYSRIVKTITCTDKFKKLSTENATKQAIVFYINEICPPIILKNINNTYSNLLINFTFLGKTYNKLENYNQIYRRI